VCTCSLSPAAAHSLSRRRIVASEHPRLAIRSYPEPCTSAAITCSNTTRSSTRRRWQPSGWVGETRGRSGSNAENWTQSGSTRQTGRTGMGPPWRGWLTPLLSWSPVPAGYFCSVTCLLSVALSLGVWVTGLPCEAAKVTTGQVWWSAMVWRGRRARRTANRSRGPLRAEAYRERPDEAQAAAGAGLAAGSGQTRSSLPRLCARQASKYSPAARARPRRLRVEKPRASLSWPKTGSTMALRRA
jgi:hypothetical protein